MVRLALGERLFYCGLALSKSAHFQAKPSVGSTCILFSPYATEDIALPLCSSAITMKDIWGIFTPSWGGQIYGGVWFEFHSFKNCFLYICIYIFIHCFMYYFIHFCSEEQISYQVISVWLKQNFQWHWKFTSQHLLLTPTLQQALTLFSDPPNFSWSFVDPLEAS